KTWTDASATWGTYPELFFSVPGVGGDLGVRAVDINNDGLTDIVRSHTYPIGMFATSTYINTGSSTFQSDPRVAFPTYITGFQSSQGVSIIDVNNDGRVDVVQSYTVGPTQKVWLASTTTSYPAWDYASGWSVPFIADTGGDNGIRYADVNGDGLVDAV